MRLSRAGRQFLTKKYIHPAVELSCYLLSYWETMLFRMLIKAPSVQESYREMSLNKEHSVFGSFSAIKGLRGDQVILR